MEIILPSTGKRVHVGVIKSMYIYMHLCLSRHFLASSIFKSFSRSRMIHNVGMAAAFGLIMIVGLTIIPFSSSSLNAAPGTTNPSNTTLTMVLSHENADLTILPSAASGTFGTSTDAETAKFNVTTDNFTGYTLSLKGTDDTRQLVNTTTSSVLDSITTTTTAAAFDTDTYNNKWGFLPSKYDSTANTDYIPAPTTTTVATLDATNTANSTAVDYSLGLGARIDINKPAGDYTNTFVLTAVGNPIHYVVNFNKNTTDSVDDMPATLDASTTATSIKIPNTTPTRAHYAFTGWCLGTTSTTDGVDTCTDGASGSGTTFQPGDDFGIDQTTQNTTTLYAMWRIDTVTVTLTAGTGIDTVAITGSGVKTGGTAGATSTAEVYYDGEITIEATPTIGYTFVDWTGDTTYTNNPETITNVTSDLTLTANAIQVDVMQNLDPSLCTTTAVSLVDSRDNQSYIVQRLADGNCWMMTNLNLGATTLANDLTAENTNISTTVSASDFNNWKKSSGSSTLTAGEYISRTGTDATSKTPYATLYNFYAASAGSINGSSNSNNATQDICPAGWRLPAGGANSEFTNLYAQSAYDSISKMRAPIQDGGGAFVLAGFFNNGGVEYSNQRGYYWASTVDGTGAMKVFSLYTTYVNADNNLNRNIGGSIRCILDENPIMQNISNSTLDSLVSNTGDSATLRDTRDNQRYTVTKLADGNVWMTQNLRFTGTELTPADTNVDSNITMNYGDLTTGNSYTQALIHDSGDLTKGVWYNFAAASAGTIASASSSSNATQDICPAGWRLPTNIEIENIVANSTSFNPTNNTGYWYNGTNASTSGGYWYSSSTGGSIARYGLNYVSGAYTVSEGGDRATGRNLRCIYDKSVDMQNISQSDLNALVPSTGSTAILRDSRDNELYRVTRLPDGNVWMTQNLRFTGTELTPADSNVASNITMSYGDLTSGDSYDQARIHISDNSEYGVWYNYAAASAGTITGNSNTNKAASSVCPKGWRLPTHDEQSDAADYKDIFKPVAGGNYNGGSLVYQTYANWWSSDAASATNRKILYYDSSILHTNYDIERYYGRYIRCIYDAPAVYMQDFSDTDAASMATNDLRTLTDNRDDQTYKVAKLADGNIWMIDNLNLNSSTITASQLDSTNTNLEPGETLAANIFKGWQTSSATATYTSGQYIPVAGTDSTSLTKNGTLYNYCAASAGTICSSSNSSNATSDICPKGWRLPTGSSTGEYQKLYNLTQYNTLAKMRSPIGNNGAAFALPGYFNTGTPIANTAYWTSMVQNTTKAYAMSINTSSGVTPSNYGERSLGFSVRCIYDKPITMQNFSITDVISMATNEVKTLVDSRDNKKYSVIKLADGNVWMAKNLRFTGTSLTPTDSNVDSNTTMNYDELANTASSYDTPKIHVGMDTDNNPTVWYNFAAATAGTITGSSNTNEGTESVCPKGWKLPSRNEISGIISYPTQFNITRTGFYIDGTLSYTQYGIWWSATANSVTNRYDLNYQNGNFVVGNTGSDRGYGDPIRCVYSRTTISDISTMQDFNSLTNEQKISVKESMAADTIYTLKDNRDDRSYNVVKLQDGKIWMASDLKLGATALTQDLTRLNTNIADTVPAATYNSWKHSSTSTNTAGKYVTNNTYMLYNYYAISAGTIAGDSNTNNTTYDICPAGWRLMSFDDIQTIYGMSSYNTYSKLRAAPTSFNMSGYFINAGITNTDNEGDYWTSTVGDTATTMKQFYLRLRGSAVIFLDQERTHGASARCVVK